MTDIGEIDGGYWETPYGKGYTYESHYPRFFTFAQELKSILEIENCKVLCLGCAKGYSVKAFREVGWNSYGVDISPEAISMSPDEIKHYLCVLDISKDRLPFDNGDFDVVTALHVFEHIRARGMMNTLIEINRLLRDEGFLLIEAPNIHNKEWLIAERVVYPYKQKTLLSRKDWIKLIQKQGFTYEEKATKLFARRACIKRMWLECKMANSSIELINKTGYFGTSLWFLYNMLVRNLTTLLQGSGTDRLDWVMIFRKNS